jgi:hypothetical protein
MSFSDNLENNLKSLESREERDPQAILRERERAQRARRDQLAAAPFAAQLRESPFTQQLMTHAARIAFPKRVKVHMAWIEDTLRLDARNLRLELRPSPRGVVAHFFENSAETQAPVISLESDPAELAQSWLSRL